jgi:hypothetical protein
MKRWYTNGVINRLRVNCPIGFREGKIEYKQLVGDYKWFNNGVVEVRRIERPVGFV